MVSQEISHLEDESYGYEDRCDGRVAILGEIGLEMKIFGTSWERPRLRTRCGSMAKMVWAYEEEMHGCSSAEV